ncbi:MAG: RNA pseudouridine synthase [Planctomycetota bacterium]
MSAIPIEANERVSFGVAHEDDRVAVIAKPPRLVTTPGVGHEHDTLLNGLIARWGDRLSQLGAARSWGLLHRLDRETSGLLLVAFDVEAYRHLRAQFEATNVRKFYWAVVRGTPKRERGVVKLPIAEQLKKNSKYTQVRTARIAARGDRAARAAVTAYRTLATGHGASLIEARPVTGRLHQIRVHLDAIGCAVLGDKLYGPKAVDDAAARLALHAHRISVEHPDGGRLDVSSGWPKDLRNVLRRAGLPRPDLEADQDD